MNTLDRLKKYISLAVNDGKLKPGDRLPSYQELMVICKCSYVTVHSAMSKLETAGLIRIESGNGSYLAGGKKLPVRFEIVMESIHAAELSALLDRHMAAHEMNFEFDIHSIHEQRNFSYADQIVIMMGGARKLDELPGTAFQAEEGYNELMREFKLPKMFSSACKLPCFYGTHQIGINGDLLADIGMREEEFTDDFSWWGDYARRCKNAGFPPAAMCWVDNDLSKFDSFRGVILALNAGQTSNLSGFEPLFNSAVGRKFLNIVQDMAFYKSKIKSNIPESFFCNHAGMHFQIGSWMSRQNNTFRRPDIKVDNLKVVPFRVGRRRLMPVDYDFLQAWIPPTATVETRSRIWQLVRMLMSRQFQLDFCNVSGAMSLRRDIAPADYAWNTGPVWDSFFIRPDDLVIDHFFSPRVTAVLGGLVDFYKYQRGNPDYILQMMDAVKNEALNPESYIHTETCATNIR